MKVYHDFEQTMVERNIWRIFRTLKLEFDMRNKVYLFLLSGKSWEEVRAFGMLYGFFNAKRKLFKLGSALWRSLVFPFHFRDFHSTGVNPPKLFPFVSKITVRVFRWWSHEGNCAPIFAVTSPLEYQSAAPGAPDCTWNRNSPRCSENTRIESVRIQSSGFWMSWEQAIIEIQSETTSTRYGKIM
jgi:hypothetical protein